MRPAIVLGDRNILGSPRVGASSIVESPQKGRRIALEFLRRVFAWPGNHVCDSFPAHLPAISEEDLELMLEFFLLRLCERR